MLIAVCIAAICFQLPYMILYMINDRRSEWWPDGDDSLLFAWIYAGMEMAEALSIANHAINFFLFCVSGSAFRRQVQKISPCACAGVARTSLLDTSIGTYCTTAQTSPAVRLQLRQQNMNAQDDVVRLAD